MSTEERRKHILSVLGQADGPVSASVLAGEFGVSRQIVVGDIALLRASGNLVRSTPRGYVLGEKVSGIRRMVASRHDASGMQRELYAIVDQGCTVEDVVVEHPIYGQLTGQLLLSCRYDVDSFIEKCQSSAAMPLSALTEGLHLHTLLAPDENAMERAIASLKEMGFLWGCEAVRTTSYPRP